MFALTEMAEYYLEIVRQNLMRFTRLGPPYFDLSQTPIAGRA